MLSCDWLSSPCRVLLAVRSTKKICGRVCSGLKVFLLGGAGVGKTLQTNHARLQNSDSLLQIMYQYTQQDQQLCSRPESAAEAFADPALGAASPETENITQFKLCRELSGGLASSRCAWDV